MSSRAEWNRREIVSSKSPIGKHSMNAHNTKCSIDGERRAFPRRGPGNKILRHNGWKDIPQVSELKAPDWIMSFEVILAKNNSVTLRSLRPLE